MTAFDAKVVPLHRKSDIGGHPVLNMVAAYWEALRIGRIVPDRSDVDPRGLIGALENCFILEAREAGGARFRISGTLVNLMVGADARNLTFDALFTPAHREATTDILDHVFGAVSAVEVSVIVGSNPSTEIAGRLLLLPLRSDLGDVTRALGCVVLEREPSDLPCRLIPGARRVDVLRAGRPLRLSPTKIASPEHAGFAEDQTNFVRPARAGRPTLRLIETKK